MVYSLLSGMLGLVYLGGIGLLQGILTTGQKMELSTNSQPPAILIIITTLAIAALFNPLRKRVQHFIDRRFYRSKYNAEQALAEFAETARSETDLQALSDKLIAVVQETVQPQSAGLWFARKQENVSEEFQSRS